MNELQEFISMIIAFIFRHSDKSAILIADGSNDVIECVRIDRDFLIVRYPER